MAKYGGGGGGGAFGWTLLGFLAGIAATLGAQILMGGRDQPSQPVASANAVHLAPPLTGAPAKPVKKVAVAASSAAVEVPAAAQVAADVADDAAAAGMTSRTPPVDGQPANRTPIVNSN
jgi:hypothetical protein